MPRAKRVLAEDLSEVGKSVIEGLKEGVEYAGGADVDTTEVFVFTPEELHLLSKCLGRNIRTKLDLLQAAQKVSTINVNGREITLEPALLQRIKSRCIRADFPMFLEATIKTQLHSFVGW